MAEQRNTINELKSSQQEPKPAEETKKKEHSQIGGRVKGILEGSFLAKEKVTKMLPFLVFLTILGITLIFSSNYANKTIIESGKTKKLIEEYRYSYINTKSKLMQTVKQSEIAKRLAVRGIKESKIPPRKILIQTNEEK
jgi:hypothetical protein